MAGKLIIVDTSGRTKHHPEALAKISGLPAELKTSAPQNEAEFLEACRDATVILLTASAVTAENIKKLPACRAVIRYGTGLDKIDVEACRARGVEVFNVRGFCTNELADHALALCLSLSRQITLSTVRARKGIWEFSSEYPSISLSGKTAGIIGTGEVGRAAAARLEAFGMDVLGFDPFYKGDEIIKMTPLDNLLKESDAVFLHCPLNEDTFHMLGEREFSLMKNTAFLINAARGGVVDEKALIKALREKKIAGAGLDVLEEEPPAPSNPLLSMENVLITPHTGAYSKEAFERLEIKVFERAAEIIKRLMDG